MQKLKNTRVLTTGAMLVAVAIALAFFKIPLSGIVEIQFTSLPLAVSGALLGPAATSVIAALSDIGAYLVKPNGAFFPGFTLSAVLSGLIFGLFFYKKEVSPARLFAAHAVNAVFVSFFLNSVWLAALYGMPYMAVLSARALKELVMFPVNFLILFAVFKPMTQQAFFKKWSAALR